MTQIEKATQEYLDRQARAAHPDGRFDNGGRWYPSEDEECPCCSRIRNPSRRWPYSLNTHCRTLKHVAYLFDVNATDLRRAVRVAA